MTMHNEKHGPRFSDGCLERLPSEIRRHLLLMLDLGSLGALIRASPIYLQQFRLDRAFILRVCLESTLGNVAVDAHAVYLSSCRDFSRSRTGESVTEFLEAYQARRSSTPTLILRELSGDELAHMLAFHVSVVEAMVCQYTSSALGNLASLTELPYASGQVLTRTEKRRIVRALYRFQICCNVFGIGTQANYFKRRPQYMHEYILDSLVAVFEPWEMEEISCIHLFAQDKYSKAFDEVRWDFDEDNPRFEEDGPFTPSLAMDLSEHSLEREYFLKGIISRGLYLLRKLFRIHNHEALVLFIDDHIVSVHTFIGEGAMEAFSDATQRRLWRMTPKSPRNLKVRQRELMPFHGDHEEGATPSLGWVLLWRETYSNMFGGCTAQKLRRWGYVMWDETRMEKTGAKGLLIQWREKNWKNEDPRDWEGLRSS
ncbi:hypothetical protein BDV59DRAFT_207739 [Aspergillus ambiguus]|uniref:uncharacterized protein n=1 Tax=Aspergillus ambiguus TaxID=176160 RepID=UPI003CCCBE21